MKVLNQTDNEIRKKKSLKIENFEYMLCRAVFNDNYSGKQLTLNQNIKGALMQV